MARMARSVRRALNSSARTADQEAQLCKSAAKRLPLIAQAVTRTKIRTLSCSARIARNVMARRTGRSPVFFIHRRAPPVALNVTKRHRATTWSITRWFRSGWRNSLKHESTSATSAIRLTLGTISRELVGTSIIKVMHELTYSLGSGSPVDDSSSRVAFCLPLRKRRKGRHKNKRNHESYSRQ